MGVCLLFWSLCMMIKKIKNKPTKNTHTQIIFQKSKWSTFACTLSAFSLVSCFSPAAGTRMSHFSNSRLPSYGLAPGNPTIVPFSCQNTCIIRHIYIHHRSIANHNPIQTHTYTPIHQTNTHYPNTCTSDKHTHSSEIHSQLLQIFVLYSKRKKVSVSVISTNKLLMS